MTNAALRSAIKRYLQDMVNASRRMDGQQAHCNTFPDSYNHGCGAHPDLEEHAQIAAALETSLRNYRLAVI